MLKRLDGILIGAENGQLFRTYDPRWWEVRRWWRWFWTMRHEVKGQFWFFFEEGVEGRYVRAVLETTVKLPIAGPETIRLTR